MDLNYNFRCYNSSYLRRRYNNELLTSQIRGLDVDQEVNWVYDHRFCGDDYVKYFSLAYKYVYNKLTPAEVSDHEKNHYPYTSDTDIRESKDKLEKFVDKLKGKDSSLQEVANNLDRRVDSSREERYVLHKSPLLSTSKGSPTPASTLTAAQRVAINPLFPKSKGSPVPTLTATERVARSPLFVPDSVSDTALQAQRQKTRAGIDALLKRLNDPNSNQGGAKKGRKSKRNKRSKNKTKRRRGYR